MAVTVTHKKVEQVVLQGTIADATIMSNQVSTYKKDGYEVASKEIKGTICTIKLEKEITRGKRA